MESLCQPPRWTLAHFEDAYTGEWLYWQKPAFPKCVYAYKEHQLGVCSGSGVCAGVATVADGLPSP